MYEGRGLLSRPYFFSGTVNILAMEHSAVTLDELDAMLRAACDYVQQRYLEFHTAFENKYMKEVGLTDLFMTRLAAWLHQQHKTGVIVRYSSLFLQNRRHILTLVYRIGVMTRTRTVPTSKSGSKSPVRTRVNSRIE